MKNIQPPYYHLIILDQEQEEIAERGRIESGRETVTAYLQDTLEEHLKKIEPTLCKVE